LGHPDKNLLKVEIADFTATVVGPASSKNDITTALAPSLSIPVRDTSGRNLTQSGSSTVCVPSSWINLGTEGDSADGTPVKAKILEVRIVADVVNLDLELECGLQLMATVQLDDYKMDRLHHVPTGDAILRDFTVYGCTVVGRVEGNLHDIVV
jgi:hypothetical protein